MKITLLNWNGTKYDVEIPDDTEYISGQVISGDHVLTYPIHFDTGMGTRTMTFDDGSFKIKRKDFKKLSKLTDPYDIFMLDTTWTNL